jgi:hypothetical protein
MTKKNIPKKQAAKSILKKTPLKKENLDDIANSAKMPSNEKEVIEELVSELNISDNYKKTEKKLKKDKLDEEDALSLDVKPDKYYSAKEKELEEDEHGGNFEESSGAFGHRT